MIKKILFILSLQTFAFAQETLKIGIEGAYPPFSFVNSQGALQGFDVDITNALCVEMQTTCEIVQIDWDGLIPALQAKKIDAIIASMSITPERLQAVDFTNKYYTNKFIYVAAKNKPFQNSKEFLKGKTVGTQRGTISAQYLEDTYGNDITINLYDNQDNVYLDLSSGRIDAVIADIFAQEIWLKTDAGRDFEFKGSPVINSDLVGIAIRKNSADLKNKLNQAIDKIVASGVYKEVSNKYFANDIY
jgi:polar amino acid transport system substrate-binding protein